MSYSKDMKNWVDEQFQRNLTLDQFLSEFPDWSVYVFVVNKSVPRFLKNMLSKDYPDHYPDQVIIFTYEPSFFAHALVPYSEPFKMSKEIYRSIYTYES